MLVQGRCLDEAKWFYEVFFGILSSNSPTGVVSNDSSPLLGERS